MTTARIRVVFSVFLFISGSLWTAMGSGRSEGTRQGEEPKGIFARGLAVDQVGNLYIADSFNHRIFKREAMSGRVIVLAGTGRSGYNGDGGPALSAQLHSPSGVAVDSEGNVYIADRFNDRVRKVEEATGAITTVAGNGRDGFEGDGVRATTTTVYIPHGVALDGKGNLYIADTHNYRVRRVELATGIITTVAGDGEYDFSGDGGPSVRARLREPTGVTVDRSGNLLIVDRFNNRIRRVDVTTGVISTVVGKGGPIEFSGDGGPATNAGLGIPNAVAVDERGNLYIADTRNNRVRRVDAGTGIITTVAGDGRYDFSGDGGQAVQASLRDPSGVAADGMGNLYIGDLGNGRIRQVNLSTGIITTVGERDFLRPIRTPDPVQWPFLFPRTEIESVIARSGATKQSR